MRCTKLLNYMRAFVDFCRDANENGEESGTVVALLSSPFTNRCKRLMFKMTQTGYHHGEVIVFAIFYRVVITDRATGLNECSNTRLMT